MKQIITAFFLISIAITVNGQKIDPRFAGLDTMINSILKEWNVPGVSISIVEKNKILFTGGFGYRDFEYKKPVTENTQFAIGSCTKSFTAALLSAEMKDKNIDLDVPVNTYLPELKFYTNDLTANITLRDMLCHRTGLPRHDFSWYSGAYTKRDSLVYAIRYLEPSTPLRQTFQYNNYMYMAIGSLLEKLNNKSWETLVQERLFTLLNMTNSTTGTFSKEGDFSYGYILKNNKLDKLDFLSTSMKGIAPVGGIVSNAKDMANWLLMWTNNGRFGEKEIISQNFFRQAISSQMIVSANLPSKLIPDYYFFNYGLGWYITNYRGHYGVGHGGNINGFSSFVSFLPADSVGIFISANQNNSEVPRVLTNIIVDRLIGATYRDWNGIMKMQANSKPVNTGNNNKPTKPSHSYSDFSGQYKNDAYGTIIIQDNKDGLSGTFNRWNLKIKHFQHNYFKFSIDENVFDGSETLNGEFTIGADGSVTSLKIPFESSVKDIEFKKQIIAHHGPTADLQQYCGDYDFNGRVAKIYLAENNILKAIVPGQPEFELVFFKQDEFAVKGAKGVSIKFDRDEKGSILSCTFIQPNGSLKVKKITKAGDKNKNESNSSANSSRDNLQKYIGEYSLSGQTVKVYLKAETLMSKIPGQPEYTLIAGNKDEFTIKGVNGYSVKFEANEKGEVIAFILAQPNGNIKATKITK